MEKDLRKIMELQGDTVYRLALCRLQNISDAEDVYQEVFLRLFKQDIQDWNDEHLKAWLIRVTLNCCADIGRFRIKRNTVPIYEEISDRQTDTEDYQELWEAVSSLSVKLRTPIHLYYMEGYSTQDIARILKIPEVTVRSRLHRARRKLKDMLGG